MNSGADPNFLHSDALVRIATAASVEELLLMLAGEARRIADATAISIMPADAAQPSFHPQAQTPACRKRGSAVSGAAMRDSRMMIAADVPAEQVSSAGCRGIAAFPTGAPIGAAVAFYWSTPHAPTEAELQDLNALASVTYCGLQRLRASEELKQSASRCQALIAQQQHTVRNVLAMIRSIVRRTAENAASSQEFSEHLGGRIDAIARTQTSLASSGDAGVDLFDLVMGELIPIAVRDEQLHVEGPPLRLVGKAAESLTLAVHELATNAMKYGALGRTQGRLRVTWQVDRLDHPAQLRLHWQEEGSPLAQLAPRQRGFGHELLECALPYELNGRTDIEFAPGGLRCRIDIPLVDSMVARPDAAQRREHLT